MRSINLTFILFALPTFISAQIYTFYIGGSHQFKSSNTFDEEYTSYSYNWLPDSTIQASEYPGIIARKNNYKTSSGYTVGVNIGWPLNEKIKIMTGVGIISTKFEISNTFESSNQDSLAGTHTIYQSRSDLPLDYLTCAFTSPVPAQVIVGSSPPEYHVYALQIPLRFELNIFRTINIATGLTLQTPLFSEKNYIEVHIDEVPSSFEGFKTCIINRQNFHDTTGSDLNNFTLLVEAEINYWKEHIGIAVGGGKMFSNFFVNSPFDESNRHLNARPFFGNIKLMYRI